MEKQLMDKIRNHTTDDIDKDMIFARLKSAHSQVEVSLNELNKSLSKLHDLCQDKKDEMALLDFRFILACDDKIIHDNDNSDNSDTNGVPILCTFGQKDEIKELLSTLEKIIDS